MIFTYLILLTKLLIIITDFTETYLPIGAFYRKSLNNRAASRHGYHNDHVNCLQARDPVLYSELNCITFSCGL